MTRFEVLVIILLVIVGLIPFLKQTDIGALYLEWMRSSQVDPGFLGLFHTALIIAGIVACCNAKYRK